MARPLLSHVDLRVRDRSIAFCDALFETLGFVGSYLSSLGPCSAFFTICAL
jgi:hypothetical protein